MSDLGTDRVDSKNRLLLADRIGYLFQSHRLLKVIVRVRRKSKKTLFNVGQCKQYNISSHLK